MGSIFKTRVIEAICRNKEGEGEEKGADIYIKI